MSNKRAKLVEINGESHSYTEWEKLRNLPAGIIGQRIKQGHTGEDLLRPAGRTLYSPGDTVEVPGYGLLIYIKDTDERSLSSGNMVGVWKCHCGKSFKTANVYINKGNTTSCGCIMENLIKERLKNPENIYLYNIWMTNIAKCNNPNNKGYKKYGAKGIKMQESWKSSAVFIQDILSTIGHRPTKEHQLDRFPLKEENYTIDNVRWATPSENCRNKTNNHMVTIDGESKTIAQWSEETEISPDTIWSRVKSGWIEEDIISPVQQRGGTLELNNIYYGIINRCYSENNPRYHRYGGRGISVYEPWRNSFEQFEKDIIAELGPRPSEKHQLDRMDNDKNYKPGILRWVDSKTNNRNKSTNVFITIKGERKTISEWAEKSGLNREMIARRAAQGWEEDKLLLPNQLYWDDEMIEKIREEYLVGMGSISMNSLSDKYNVHRGTVIDMIRGRAHYSYLEDISMEEGVVDEEGVKTKIKKTVKITDKPDKIRNYNPVEVTEEQLSQMEEMKNNGHTYAKIAEETGFAKSSVRSWLINRKETTK